MSEYRNSEGVEPILPRSIPESERPRAPQVQPRTRSFFWPIVLIGVGVLLLLSNLSVFPESGWAVLWRFWPVALVALGIDVLIGRRSFGGAIASGVLLLLLAGMVIGVAFFAEQIPALVEITKPARLQFEHVEHPLANVKSAKVTIDWTSAPGYLSALEDSNNLIEGDVAYRGDLVFRVSNTNGRAEVLLDSYFQNASFVQLNFADSEATWDMKLSPAVPLELWLNVGSGNCIFDLSRLNLSALNLDGGSGSLDLTLPATSSFTGKLDTGSGSVVITLPDGVGMRVTLDSGSGSFQPDERFTLVSGERDDDGVWEIKNYASADYKIDLVIDQGSGSIRIR
ncbi:MAG TPA: DUF5668 domain-containing protein [Anaerolineae bacterium]|nr:DUF5668 domain-containing protein [Anaerolineae bacterium]HQI85320.1 DUF5668 domain-containing protein [Anaerolineae bacterium]